MSLEDYVDAGPKRYELTYRVVVEVERPDGLLEAAKRHLRRRGEDSWVLDGLDRVTSNQDVAALQGLLDPQLLMAGIAEVAFVEATWGAEVLPPPTDR